MKLNKSISMGLNIVAQKSGKGLNMRKKEKNHKNHES